MNRIGSARSKKSRLMAMAVSAVLFTTVGVVFWIVVAYANKRDLQNIELGFSWFMKSIGALSIGIGALFLVSQILAEKGTALLLRAGFLIAAGIAVYSLSVFSTVGLALMAGALWLNEFMQAKYHAEDGPEESQG